MIGRRSLVAAVVVGAGLVLALGPGAPRPEVEHGAERLVVERAMVAEERLAALAQALRPVVEAGRAGSARVVAGDAPPGDKLLEAAELLERAQPVASGTVAAITALEAARRARDPAVARLAEFAPPGELSSIAQQLRATAPAADEFAAHRASAAVAVAALRRALDALDAGDLVAAGAAIEEARNAHDEVAAWELETPTLPVWVETTDAMIGAVERIVTATERGDAAAAEEAAADFAALEDEGATADRALRIAIGEGGGALAAVPLERLASVLAAVEAVRGAVSGIRGVAGA